MFCLWEMCLVISDVCLCVCGGTDVVVAIMGEGILRKGGSGLWPAIRLFISDL